jgi:agmatinase
MRAEHRRFADAPEASTGYERSAVVVLPVPFEGTSTYLPGTSRGPAAVLEASRALELYEPDLGLSPYQAGIHVSDDIEAYSSEDMVQTVQRRVAAIIANGKLPLVLGGEHAVAVGAFRALSDRHPSLCYLSLDAHADLRPAYEGNPLSHASVSARFQDTAHGVHVGLRSLSVEESQTIAQEGIPCVWAWETRIDGWIEHVFDSLGDPVYVSLDLDVFDPSVLPAVGCPEPGGLSWWDVDSLLREVMVRRRVVGVDVSELAPTGTMAWCDFFTARLIYRLVGYFWKSQLRPPRTPGVVE